MAAAAVCSVSALPAADSSCRQAGGSGGSNRRWLRHPPAAAVGCRASRSRRTVKLSAAPSGRQVGEPGQDAADAAAAAAGPAAQPLPSRVQREVDALVGLDVEYTHLRLLPGGRHISLPVEVCAVDAQGRTLLYSHCDPLEGQLGGARWEHRGGHHPALWQGATPLGELRSQLAGLLEGRVLVGHHLRKDLGALGLSHPEAATRDTLQYREMQGRRGSGRKLRDLSAEKLGRRIQRSGQRHSPREDAQAALDLYLRHIHFERRNWSYEDLVEQELAAILASAGGTGAAGSAEASSLGDDGAS